MTLSSFLFPVSPACVHASLGGGVIVQAGQEVLQEDVLVMSLDWEEDELPQPWKLFYTLHDQSIYAI